MKLQHSLKIIISVFALSGLLTSCGNDSTVPLGGFMRVEMDTFNLTNSAYAMGLGYTCQDVYPPQGYDIVPVRVALFDRILQPMGNTEFDVYVVFSSSNTNAGAAVWIFEDLDGNGTVVDAGGVLQDAELKSGVGAPVRTPFETNEFGWKDFFLVFDSACAWTGQLNINSGPTFESIDITKG